MLSRTQSYGGGPSRASFKLDLPRQLTCLTQRSPSFRAFFLPECVLMWLRGYPSTFLDDSFQVERHLITRPVQYQEDAQMAPKALGRSVRRLLMPTGTLCDRGIWDEMR